MAKIQLRKGLRADWLASSVVLANGEPGFATDTGDLRIGDGVHTWSNLPEVVATALTNKVDKNSSITGATKTKITYDAKGLVTAGTDATQDDIGDGTTNKQYSATEKTKLAGIAAGATANSSDATLLNRANHTGTQSADTLTDGTTNKAFLATERTKLSGIATGATANDTDANLKNRANHTGSQAESTVTGLVNDLAGRWAGAIPFATQWWISAPGYLGTVASTLTSQRCTFHPFLIAAGTYDALAINVSTAQVGGTVTCKLALYKDDGSGSWPDTTNIIVSSTIVLTATGNATGTFTSTALTAGLYWAACFYNVSVSPTTAPQVRCLTNTSWALGLPNSIDATTRARGYYRSSLTDLPTDATTTGNVSVSASNDIPAIGLRKA